MKIKNCTGYLYEILQMKWVIFSLAIGELVQLAVAFARVVFGCDCIDGLAYACCRVFFLQAAAAAAVVQMMMLLFI